MLDDELTKFKKAGNFLSFSMNCIDVSLCVDSFQILDASKCLLNVSIITHGILLIEPEDSQFTDKDIVLSCGIHGNETAPIEILNNLLQKIFSKKLAVKQRLLFIIGNLPAIKLGKRFIDENLNNLFATNNNNKASINFENFEQKRVKIIEQTVNDFFQFHGKQSVCQQNLRKRIHLDLHTAIKDSVYPKFAVYPIDELSLIDHFLIRLLQQSEVNTVLFSYQPTKTFCYYTYKHCQAMSLTIELGKVKPFGENNLADFEKILLVLARLINNNIDINNSIAVNNEITFTNMHFFEIQQRIFKQTENFNFTFSEQTPNFFSFKQGDLLAKDDENCHFAKENEEVILFPNKNVKIGQRALLTAKPISIM